MLAIVLRTLIVSGAATALAVTVGVPIGYAIGRRRFRGRTPLLGAVNTGMGMPPVVVGLIVWLLLVMMLTRMGVHAPGDQSPAGSTVADSGTGPPTAANPMPRQPDSPP